MEISTRALRFGAQLAVVAGAIAAASCGGSVNTTPVATFGTFTAPPVNGLSATFNVAPGAPPGTTATVTSSATAPSGVPAPSSIVRKTQSIAGAVPFLFVSIELSQPVPTSLFISEVLTLTNPFSTSAGYFVEIDDPSATKPKLTTITGTIGGSVVTFTNSGGSGGSGITTLAANHRYVFQFYEVAAATPTPTATPTPPPPGVLGVNPTTVPIYGTRSGNAASVLVQETGYTGTLSEIDTCTGIATVTPSSGTGPSVTFTITGVAAGSCTATFSDTNGQHVSAAVGVTTSGFGVDAQAREGE